MIIFFGNDDDFANRLSKSAQAKQMEYVHWRSDQSVKKLPDQACLLIVDGQDDRALSSAAEMIKNHPDSVVVLAIGNDGPPSTQDAQAILGYFDDILLKTDNHAFLDKKVGFYVNHSGSCFAPQDSELCQIRKQNNSLTCQISHLQQRIVQADSDLNIQKEVLKKVTQIRRLAHEINCLELEKIARVCIEEIPKLISARYASLYTYDEDHGVLHLLHHNHPYAINRLIVLHEHPQSLMAQAIHNLQLLLIPDLGQWLEANGKTTFRQFAPKYQTKSCIVAPLMSGGNIFGVLNLADKFTEGPFDATTDLPPIELFCDIIGSAMSNIKLYQRVQKQAQTDSMTGLVNHSTFYSELDKELNRARRYGGSLSLVMVDLDELKPLNDTYGHLAGDSVLIHVAEQIKNCVRKTDIAARYGGDEFALILPNTNISEAKIMAQRLVESVSKQPVAIEGHCIKASVSVGVSQYHQHRSLEEFIDEADAALFEAKATGRNRMQVFQTGKS